jgi:hypothetical protein
MGATYNLTELVKETAVFEYYRDGQLFYAIKRRSYIDRPDGWTELRDGGGETLFRFPIPLSDAGSGTFLAVDKAITFMRWIRPAVVAANAELSLMRTPLPEAVTGEVVSQRATVAGLELPAIGRNSASRVDLGYACCDNEDRDMDGGCRSCGDPCL